MTDLLSKTEQGIKQSRESWFSKVANLFNRPRVEEETWEEQPRMEMPRLPVPERKHSFIEIEQGFSEEQARQEAKRCLRCDLET